MLPLETLDGPGGMAHTVSLAEEGVVLVATEEHAMLVASDASITVIDVRSSAAMVADDGSVWFAGGAESTLMPRWADGELQSKRLAAPLGAHVSSSSSDGHRWVLFGLDEAGEHAALMLDVDQLSSPFSGRGFLNLLSLVVGTASIVGLANTSWRQTFA